MTSAVEVSYPEAQGEKKDAISASWVQPRGKAPPLIDSLPNESGRVNPNLGMHLSLRIRPVSIMARLLVLGFSSVLLPLTAPAQQAPALPTAVNPFVSLDAARQHQESPTGPDFSTDTGGLDVRILPLTEVPDHWTVAASVNEFYSTNATLEGVTKRPDFYTALTGLVGYTPDIVPGILRGLFTVREDIFRYDKLSPLDFEYLEASAGLGLSLPQIPNTVLSVRYVYSLLTDSAFEASNFDEHALNIALQTNWRYSQTFQFAAGLETQQSLQASPEAGRRTDYLVRAAFLYQPLESLQCSIGYVGGYFNYGFLGRDDFNHVFRVGITYHPVKWAWVGASASYVVNDSNHGAFSYDEWLIGLGAGVEFHF